MMKWFFTKKKKYTHHEIHPDEVLLDSRNIPEFNVHQMQGVIEQQIPRSNMVGLGILLGVCLLIIVGKLFQLQVTHGQEFFVKSEQNRLSRIPLFADRGVVYDRNGVELIWNSTVSEETPFSLRQYIASPGFSHILGYVHYPAKDSSGNYWRKDYEPRDGVEKWMNNVLQPMHGYTIVEKNALSGIESDAVIQEPLAGNNVMLSIDAGVQESLAESLHFMISEYRYMAGVAAVMDIHTGEMISLVSMPEYSSDVLANSKDPTLIGAYFRDPGKPFLNRVVSGLYTPGSIVKPFLALGALAEGIIQPSKIIVSTGSIEIPNPYFPDKPTIFRDWKAHGPVDLRKAIAVSSNIYFYALGGGFKDQPGLGIERIEKYVRMFGIGEKTNIVIPGELYGSIPNPEWKKQRFAGDAWRLGDTYHTSIGQYGFQVTPIQMVRAVAGLARRGVLVEPTLLQNQTIVSEVLPVIDDTHYQVIHEAMRQTVTHGTAQQINLSNMSLSAKTGTAEVGTQQRFVNSWLIGFGPFENPRYSFVIVLERGPAGGVVPNASFAMRRALLSMQEKGVTLFSDVKNID
jgi:penicillin-binding protein 2